MSLGIVVSARISRVGGQERFLESFADPHAESVSVPPLGDIGTKIDMILLAQQEPQPTATTGKEFLTPIQLVPRGNRSANASEYDQAKPLWQDQSIFKLRCERIASKVLSRRVSA